MSDTTVRDIEGPLTPLSQQSEPDRARNGHKVSDQGAPGGPRGVFTRSVRGSTSLSAGPPLRVSVPRVGCVKLLASAVPESSMFVPQIGGIRFPCRLVLGHNGALLYQYGGGAGIVYNKSWARQVAFRDSSSARGATFRRAGGLLDRGEAAIEKARAGQGVLIRDEARQEPSEGVEPVLDEALEGVLAALFADELGVLQRAAQVELVGAPGWRGDADAGVVHVGDDPERRAARHQIRRLDLHVARGEVDRVRSAAAQRRSARRPTR